ncbi:histidine phosphatase family protein [Jiangella endophytica]|uniref:histidine phosphatase family protein n=1 Tax=Jiangella endophytica TaxID=1623398 RepID=UPI000E35347E|nr:histidine phosphatase family protein [Jiangella endophytica]
MTTYVLRHGPTATSRRYLVNGDPAVSLPLDEHGVEACRQAALQFPPGLVRTWLSSEFPRARQTASLLADALADVAIDWRLNELDYGDFEGHPFTEYAHWLREHGCDRRPPGSSESQREAMRRMVGGAAAALLRPAPRVVVCHGLLFSLIGWTMRPRPAAESLPLFYAEAPYVEALAVPDNVMKVLLGQLRQRLNDDPAGARSRSATLVVSGPDGAPQLASVDRAIQPTETKDTSHA